MTKSQKHAENKLTMLTLTKMLASQQLQQTAKISSTFI